jgi:hypothetical protein
MRKLATIRKINNIFPIPEADAIECAVVDGWEVVVKKDDFSVGDHCIYLEIDSWVPTDLAPFLSKGKEPREYMGIKGERLKTARMKKQLSQGLILKIDDFPQVKELYDNLNLVTSDTDENYDVSELLGIIKWEPELNAKLGGRIRGNFPSFIPKTDQERIQNLTRKLEYWKEYSKEFSLWEVSEKLDGSSMTVYINADDDTFHVCSRNLDLECDENNAFWRAAINQNLKEKLQTMNNLYGGSLALQGELIGEGIQKNPYKMHDIKFRVFDIYDIQNVSYVPSRMRELLCVGGNIEQVPIIDAYWLMPRDITVAGLLTLAEGKSVLNEKTEREGLVFKNKVYPNLSFKAISNKFLLKNDG